MSSRPYASLALHAGINVKVVSSRLGNANVAFTLTVYSHAIPEMDEAAAETFAAFIWRAGGLRR